MIMTGPGGRVGGWVATYCGATTSNRSFIPNQHTTSLQSTGKSK